MKLTYEKPKIKSRRTAYWRSRVESVLRKKTLFTGNSGGSSTSWQRDCKKPEWLHCLSISHRHAQCRSVSSRDLCQQDEGVETYSLVESERKSQGPHSGAISSFRLLKVQKQSWIRFVKTLGLMMCMMTNSKRWFKLNSVSNLSNCEKQIDRGVCVVVWTV